MQCLDYETGTEARLPSVVVDPAGTLSSLSLFTSKVGKEEAFVSCCSRSWHGLGNIGCLPFDVEARDPWLADQDLSPDLCEVDSLWRVFTHLFGLVCVVDIVSYADEFLVLVRCCEEDDGDA